MLLIATAGRGGGGVCKVHTQLVGTAVPRPVRTALTCSQALKTSNKKLGVMSGLPRWWRGKHSTPTLSRNELTASFPCALHCLPVYLPPSLSVSWFPNTPQAVSDSVYLDGAQFIIQISPKKTQQESIPVNELKASIVLKCPYYTKWSANSVSLLTEILTITPSKRWFSFFFFNLIFYVF